MASEDNTTTTTTTTTTTSSPSPSPLLSPQTLTTTSEDAVSVLSFISSASSFSEEGEQLRTPPPSPPRSPPPSPPTPLSTEDRRRALTCSLCLDIFRTPKLLPCSHTFCQRCLEKLVAHIRTPTPSPSAAASAPTVVFQCPNCRKGIVVPEGGARAFQTNFYLMPEDLAKARDGTQCLSHPGQELDLFCADCQLPVCLQCRLTQHEDHQLREMTAACLQARDRMKQIQQRLQGATASVEQQLDSARKEQQAQLDKRTAMESLIRKQHGTLVAAAEKFLVEALATLKTASEGQESTLHQQVLDTRERLDNLCRLQEDTGQVLNIENRYKLLAAVKDFNDGKGSLQTLDSILSGSQEVSQSDLQPEFILNHFQHFLTTVSAVDTELRAFSEIDIQKGVFNVKHIKVSVSVTKEFKCGKRYDSEIFCVCPLDDDSVWISYEKNGPKDLPAAEKYDKDGSLLCSSEKMLGKVSFKSIGCGKIRHLIPFAGGTRAFSKWGNTAYFKLSNSEEGRASITRVKVITEDPFNAQLSQELSIKVGPHRGFDVDCSEDLIVILEEPLPPETKRQVKMYKRGEEDPVAIYTPPSPTFQPSDVCFCRLGGDAAVLVADELGDSIHVLSVKEDGTMCFLRYLAPGSPALVHPTALNVDTRGRLWVACRGGQLLTMVPVT